MKRFWLLALFVAGTLTAALSTPAFAAKSEEGTDASADQSQTMDDINSALGSMAAKMDEVESKIGSLKFFGDMRIRYAFITQNSSQTGVTISDQSMGRYRARFGASLTSGDFTGKIRIATGATNSPWSQNNTFDTAMVDPTVNIDTAEILWKPGFANGMLSFIAGKMDNPLTKTVITWDPDIQPEGALAEFKSGDFALRATYFELQNQFASGTTFGNMDLFMDNLQAEYGAKLGDDSTLGLMAGYEYIPNSTKIMSSGVSAALGKNPITGFTGVLDPGGVARDWNNVEAMVYLKHNLGDVPMKWYIHATDNLNGKNLPDSTSPTGYSSTFTNQYAFLVGVDIGANREPGEFAGTLLFAETDPNCQLPYLVDDDSGRTNTQYVFGSLSTLMAKGVTLKLSEWIAGHEYNALLGASKHDPAVISYLDCIVNL